MKKIALFSDGTGNSSSSPQKTNVWRAYEALDTSAASNQIAFYDNGIGTSSFTPTAVLGLAFGWGMARNVQQIYGFLCRTYAPGDEIYAFGFSRGAFTIRVAVALIASQGIINRNLVKDEGDLDRLIAAAYHRYRQESFTPSLLSVFLRPVRDIILHAWDCVRRRQPYQLEKNIRYPAHFKITEPSLQGLQSDRVPLTVLGKLTGIKNEEFTGEKVFLDTLEATIGKQETGQYKSLFLQHARYSDNNPAHFKLTEPSLQELQSDCVPLDVLKKLTGIKNEEFAGEKAFLDALEATIGKQETGQYKSLFLQHARNHLIKFIGVWDTVDAYGLPVDELTRAWDKVVWPLTSKDRNLSPRVARACHALALDEQRESFEPMLWNEDGGNDKRLSQVWFPGVHANVGGGYPDDALAFTPLNWILDESHKNDGLTYLNQERQRFTGQDDIMGPIYDNRSGVGNMYRYAPRNLERLCQEKKPGLANWLKDKLHRPAVGLANWLKDKTIRPGAPAPAFVKGLTRNWGPQLVHENEVNIEKPKLHHSVFDRVTHSGDAYAPINVPQDYAVVTSTGTVIDIHNPGPIPALSLETGAQAITRRQRQAYVWNKVWWRKLLYFITLIITIWFICYPYIASPAGNGKLGQVAGFLESLLGTFSFVVRAIPSLIGKIPGLGFAKNWASEYANFPFVFSLGIFVIGGLLIWSSKVNAAIKSDMRINWHHLTNTGSEPPATVRPFRKWLAHFLEGPIYQDKIDRFGRIGLETIAVVFLVWLVVAACSHLVFAVVDGFGGICGSTPRVENPAFGAVFEFDPTDPCFATGLELTKHKQYVIEFQISDNWRDKTIEADVKGWRSAPWYMHLFTPVRRHLFAGWYQPIARIDDNLFDRYPLRATQPQPENNHAPQTRLRMEFKARRTGQLYLYLNDAVFFVPGIFRDIYANNAGKARVIVTDLGGTS